MKRLLSVILTIAMILALVPAVFAAGGIELDLKEVTVYTNSTTKTADKVTVTQENGVIAVDKLSVRRYGSTNDTGQFVAFSFHVDTTDYYTINFKTDDTGFSNRENAVAPSIYILNGKDKITGGAFASATYAANKVGYFNFSTIKAKNQYESMTINSVGVDSGKPIELRLKGGEDYTILLFADETSLFLNNKTAGGDVKMVEDGTEGKTYYFYNNAIRPRDDNSAILETTYKQNLRISGVSFEPVSKPQNAYQNPSDSSIIADRDGTVALLDMEVRRYGVSGENGPILSVPFTVDKTGDYTFAFKTSEDGIDKKAFAAAPAVYVFEYDITANKSFATISKNATLERHVGYFNFSNISKANEFIPMNIDVDGKSSETLPSINLTQGNKYTLVFFCDATSLALNYNTKNGEVDLSVYDCDSSGVRKIVDDEPLPQAYRQEIYLAGIEMNYVEPPKPEEDEALTNAFNPTPDDLPTQYAPSVSALKYVNGAESAVEAISVSATDTDGDGTYNVSTSTTDNAYKFLYWVKGKSTSKIIVSRNASFNYTPGNGDVNYLIAVYEKADGTAGNKAEFFNANGQLVGTLEADGETPALPSMAGYGTAKAWVGKDGTRLNAGQAVAVVGTAMYIAEYAEPETTYSIDTTKCYTDKDSYKYGELVTCTATGTEADGTFKCWKRDGQIVSTKPTYSFSAWKNHTVEAVYTKEEFTFNGAAQAIIVEIFGDNVMAEFIGFTNVVEKGIILGTQEIAMTTDKTQFTVENNVDATTAKGYVIVKDGSSFKKYTDGEISLTSK